MDNCVQTRLIALGGRLRETRVSRGLTQKEFAALGGVGVTSQQQYEAGKTAPAVDYFFRLSEVGLHLADLLPFDDEQVDDGSIAAIVAPDALQVAKGKIGKPRAPQVLEERLDLVAVQEIDLAYGLGGAFTDSPIEIQNLHFPRVWIEAITSTPSSMLTIARGRGDSMQPTIQDGDMVMIDRSQRTIREQDAIWALTIGELGMIKRIRAGGERVKILSDNDRVPPDEVHHEEINIVGRVIFIGRRI